MAEHDYDGRGGHTVDCRACEIARLQTALADMTVELDDALDDVSRHMDDAARSKENATAWQTALAAAEQKGDGWKRAYHRALEQAQEHIEKLAAAEGERDAWMKEAACANDRADDALGWQARAEADEETAKQQLVEVRKERDALWADARKELMRALLAEQQLAEVRAARDHDGEQYCRALAAYEEQVVDLEQQRDAARAALVELRADLAEEQSQRSRAINAEATILTLREALLSVRNTLCRCVPDSYSQPAVDEDAAACDAIIDAALATPPRGTEDDKAAMAIDPNPPGVTQRPWTPEEMAALDGHAPTCVTRVHFDELTCDCHLRDEHS